MKTIIIKQKDLGGFRYSIKNGNRKGFILISQKAGMGKDDAEDWVEINIKTIPKLIKVLREIAGDKLI